MAAIDEILAQVPLDQVAATLGVDRSQVEQASRKALPALLGGLEANAKDSDGAASLTRALDKHRMPRLNVDEIDAQDGDKIVGHIFGQKRDQVTTALAPGEGQGGLIQKLLPLLAPIVMSWLAGRMSRQTPEAGSAGGGGGLGDILGKVLEGTRGDGSAGGLDDLLGGLLGGGRRT